MDGKTPEQEVKIYDEIREALGGVHLSGPMQRVIEVAWPMAYQAGREDAAREFLGSVTGYRVQLGGNYLIARPDEVTIMRAASAGGDDWCPCPDVDVSTFLDGPGTRTVRGRPDPSCPVHGNEINLGRSSRGVGDNTEEQQQGNAP